MGRHSDYNAGKYDTNRLFSPVKFIEDTKFMRVENYNEDELSLGGFTSAPNWFRDAFLDIPDYDIIEPSLQLATKLLTLPRVQKFFNAVLGDLKIRNNDYTPNYRIVQNPIKRHLQYCEIKPDEWDPDRPVPGSELSFTMQYLEKMLKTHKFHSYVLSPDSTKRHAETTQLDSEADYRFMAPVDEDFFCYGWHSETKIPEYMYEELEAATRATPLDIPLLLFLRFDFAVTVVHELAHAARNCLSGKHDTEPYFGDNPISELGLELESFMFDGIVQRIYSGDAHMARYTHGGRTSKLRGVLALWEYPCQGSIADYAKDYADQANKYKGIECRYCQDLKLRPLDVAWRVPLSFVAKFFDENWWNGPRQTQDTHPERRVGYCFRIEPTKNREPVIMSTAERKYLPAGYRRSPRTGDIVPRNKDVLVSDVVRTRLIWDLDSEKDRGWAMPYEAEKEYEGLSTKERRRREIIYHLGEDLSLIGPGGKYENADSTDQGREGFPGNHELLLGCLLDGILRLPGTPFDFTRNDAIDVLNSLDEYDRADLSEEIAENNFKLRSEGGGGSQEQATPLDHDNDMEVDLDSDMDVDSDLDDDVKVADPDYILTPDVVENLLLGTFPGSPVEQSAWAYRVGNAFLRYVFGPQETQLTQRFRPYSSQRVILPSTGGVITV